ncbi:MAG: hypothetical protein P0Y62_07355 [Candidatus Chryseobacterium colombiense]|nr:hypothetical protein [Chryseobacterium sp.]WEK71370.1 MAG: hypothetical protein P0Y62_07355 [Chryseobacterium sp.]
MQVLYDIKNFFKEYPLYKEFLYIENYVRTQKGIVDPYDFNQLSFEYFCDEEQTNRTFEIDLLKSTKEYYNKFAGNKIPSDCFDENDHLSYEIHLLGICKSCQKKQVDFLIKVKSDQQFPNDKDNIVGHGKDGVQHIDIIQNKQIKIYLTKVGINPEPKINIDKSIQKYFDRETNNWYFKGIKQYQIGFGIGSLAYFRRIIEKELFHILENISDLNSSDPKLKKIIEEFDKNSKMSTLYNSTFSLLPKSLQILGHNPLEILYRLTSEGLHNISEQESLEKADKIHKLLDFVIKKINEENSELKEIRDLINELKK